MDNDTFGILIRGHRKQANLTQKQLAEKLGVVESTVRMWELNKNYPTVPLLILLFKVLQIPFDKLADC